ncbi:hypothetical protein HaLaN_16199 [Haematococcus lacustris]|uniref:Uncharacterized protein n=1 Tax=Haematococcus lacustris TaxID=44745 RepID=A0A699ZL61_HAELA|nr:hypothetical protein HaLaN_16199 [Haematococcus lacustris]
MASERGPSTPPPAKRTKAEQAAGPSQPAKGKGKAQGKADETKPEPQPGRGQAMVKVVGNHAMCHVPCAWEHSTQPLNTILSGPTSGP